MTRVVRVLMTVTFLGCVTPYNQRISGKADDGIPPLAFLDADATGDLQKAWLGVYARCMNIEKAMNDEIQAIDLKNNALGSVWAGITTALSAANGLYNAIAGDNANKIATTLLAFGAAGASIPTFFYFGSDKRQAFVKQSLADINASMAAAQASQKAIQQAVLDLNSKKRDYSAARSRLEFLNGTTCPAPAGGCTPAGGEIKRLRDELATVPASDTSRRASISEQIKKLQSEADGLPGKTQDLSGDVGVARGTYQAAINTFNAALIELRQHCN